MKNRMNIRVLFEDNHLIAVYKPAGVLVQGDSTGDWTLADWVKQYIKDRYNKPGAVFLGIIHRIDRPVSGVVIFARTSKALSRMNEAFRNQQIEKIYWAVSKNRPKKLEDTLVHFLLKDTTKNKTKAFLKPSRRAAKAKRAELSYKTIGIMGDHALLEVSPKTGRPHQIRVQLATMGCVIKGDLKYGDTQPNPDASIYLHCQKMAFIHPVKKEKVSISVDPPDLQMWQAFGLTP